MLCPVCPTCGCFLPGAEQCSDVKVCGLKSTCTKGQTEMGFSWQFQEWISSLCLQVSWLEYGRVPRREMMEVLASVPRCLRTLWRSSMSRQPVLEMSKRKQSHDDWTCLYFLWMPQHPSSLGSTARDFLLGLPQETKEGRGPSRNACV